MTRNPHPPLEDLAALAEHRLAPTERERVLAHAAGCRNCAAHYAAAVRHRADALAPPLSEPTPAPGRRRRRLGAWWPVPAGAAAAAVAVWLLIAPGLRHTDADGLPVGDLLGLLAGTPARDLVYPVPGTERVETDAPRYRGAPGTELREVLADLERAYLDEGRTDAAFWLAAAQLEAGYLIDASTTIVTARARGGGDPRLGVLEAMVEYRSGRPDVAEEVLVRVLAADPGDAYARCNLAVLLLERGARAEAAGEAERVLELTRDERLAARARDVKLAAGHTPPGP